MKEFREFALSKNQMEKVRGGWFWVIEPILLLIGQIASCKKGCSYCRCIEGTVAGFSAGKSVAGMHEK